MLSCICLPVRAIIVSNSKIDAKNTDKESSGGSNAFLEAEVLEDSLDDEEILLRSVASRQMKLNKHGPAAL